MRKAIQAKDIPDERILSALHGTGEWRSVWDITEELPEYPPKVVAAKLCQMARRADPPIRGCTSCRGGCRGDWHLVPQRGDSDAKSQDTQEAGAVREPDGAGTDAAPAGADVPQSTE